ncbi:MAG: hypothetical protein IJW20_04175 [Clostridia bacterium]|nr:hypothetical protein [Clostridia bacterium]
MENAAKALEIAAGVLLAVLIMSLIAYFFSSVRLWPEEEDSMETAEQLAKFNLEYEVFDKKAMYGADVISCLTKAQSNNEKYVAGEKYLTGNKYGEKYWINVYVNIKSDLEESLEVYYFDETTAGFNKQKMLLEGSDVTGSSAIKMGDVGFVFNKKDGNIYSTFDETTPLLTKYEEIAPTELSGIEGLSTTETNKLHNGTENYDVTPLQTLVSFASTNMKQTVTNQGGQDQLKIWSSAVWTSALYDFKTRRFRCDDIKYSDITGRVNEIYFSEI